MAEVSEISRNVIHKLDQMPTNLDIDIDADDIIQDINDAERETGIKVDTLDIQSKDALEMEYRILYYVISRIRNSSASLFKYTGGNDGKSVDKTKICKNLDKIIDELDTRYHTWIGSRYKSTHKGRLSLNRRTSKTLGGGY